MNERDPRSPVGGCSPEPAPAAGGAAATSAYASLPAWARTFARTASALRTAGLAAVPASACRPSDAGPRADRARRGADDGEPLVRQPARDGPPPGQGTLARRRTHRQGRKGRQLEPEQYRAVRDQEPGRDGAAGQLAVPGRGTPEPGLERVAPLLEQRSQQRFRPGIQRTVAMWYWDEHDVAVHLLARPALPVRSAVLLLGARRRPTRTAVSCSAAPRPASPPPTATTFRVPAANGTIFNQLLRHNISWRNYVQLTNGRARGSALIVPEFATSPGCLARMQADRQLLQRCGRRARCLPFSFIDPNYDIISEENPQDIQAGERFIAQVVNALTHSPTWQQDRAVHHLGRARRLLRPRAAAEGDQARQHRADHRSRRVDEPKRATGAGGYDRYGFRVPLLVISPWARANYVSTIVAGPHLDPRLHRAQVEPAGADVPGRQRPPADRLLRLQPARRSPSHRSWPRRRR